MIRWLQRFIGEEFLIHDSRSSLHSKVKTEVRYIDDTSTMDLTSVFTLARNDTDEVDLWQKNYGEMNEASFSKLTSDKYSQVHLLALWSAKAREKGDVLRGQKKTSHNDRIPFFSIFP